MPSVNLRQQIDHQAEVNRLMLAACAVEENQPVLSTYELAWHTRAVEMGATPQEFVDAVLAQRSAAPAPLSIATRATPDPRLVARFAAYESRGYGDVPETALAQIGVPMSTQERVA